MRRTNSALHGVTLAWMLWIAVYIGPACLAGAGEGNSATADLGAATTVPKVLAKLHQSYCGPAPGSTRAIVNPVLPTATIRAVQQAAATVGLSFDSHLPVRCWVVLKPAATLASTQSAIDALTAPQVSAQTAGVSQTQPVFEFVTLDQMRYLVRPYNSTIPQQQATQLSTNSSRNTSSSSAWQPAFPPECNAELSACGNWGLKRIRATELWQDLGPLFPLHNITYRGTIIDTGIDPENFNIIPQLDKLHSITISSGGNVPANGTTNVLGHGSHVFGIAAGGWGSFNGQDDPTGVAGVVGPFSEGILSCNPFGTNPKQAQDSDLVNCLMHAVNASAHWVVNLSLGGADVRNSATHQLYYDAFQAFCQAGGIAVISAGNGVPFRGDYVGVDMGNSGLLRNGTIRPNRAEYPGIMAEYYPDCVVAVANLKLGDSLSTSSNWGTSVRIAAPGENILSSWLSDVPGDIWATATISGTSMAAPQVAGAALLLRNLFPSANGTQVVQCMLASATQQPAMPVPGSVLGGGILDVRAAYECLAGLELFNCRTQTVPPCVEVSSGVPVPNGNCTEGFFCMTFDLPLLGNVTVNGTTDGLTNGTGNNPFNDTIGSNDTVGGNNTDVNNTTPYTPVLNGTTNSMANGNDSVNTTRSATVPWSHNGTVTCRYRLKPAQAACITDANTSSTCTASSATCLAPPRFCQRPPGFIGTVPVSYNASLNSGTNFTCTTRVPVGGLCNATCGQGWSGAGFLLICLSNGTWAAPVGNGCTQNPVERTTCSNMCRVGNVCNATDGCRCVQQSLGNSACSCPAGLGFTEVLTNPVTRRRTAGGTNVNVRTSRCLWDVLFPWNAEGQVNVTSSNVTYFLEAPINASVALWFAVGRNVNVCPVKDVVSAATWLAAPVACPTGPRTRAIVLSRSNATALTESCSRRRRRSYSAGGRVSLTPPSNTLTYVFRTFRRSAAGPLVRGQCFWLQVKLTDGMAYVVVVRLT